MKKTLTGVLAGAAVLAVGTTSAMAAGIADIYKDRTVTILVGYGAGGTYGQTSLLLSRHFGTKIPGNPSVIVQHMPGAGGLKATNYAYNVLPKNGLNILMPPEMTLVSQMLRPKRVKFVANKFQWIGRVFGANQVMMVRRDTGIKSLEDLTRREIIVASTGAGSPTYLVPKMMNGLLGTRFKIVTGYKGSAKTSLSVEQGETFGMSNMWPSWKKNRGTWFQGGDKSFALTVAQVGFEREPDLPDVPLLSELAKSKEDKAVASLLSTASIIGRGIAFPPGVANNILSALRTSFDATIADPKFRSDAAKRNLPVTPLSGGQIQKIINDTVASLSPTVVAKASKIIFGK